ncbi:MAG: hypothetical protein AB8H79_22760 [Myxococcota bacterium]
MNKFLVILPLVALLGCTGDDTDESDTDTDTVAQTWQEMDFTQRQTYMATDVMPAMQTIFAEYDSTRFETITCATCHGAGATDGTFSMPSDSLFPIDFANFPTGPGADFMMNEVVPDMTELLDMEPFNQETGEGFGCLGCHPAAG